MQAVLFRNPRDRVLLSLESVVNAVSSAADTVDRAVVRYGDAGPEPLFGEDEIAALAERFSDEIELSYVHFGRNTGYGLGQNLLAADGDEDLIFAINPDVVLAPTCLSSLAEMFEDPTVGIVDAKQVPIEHPKDFELGTGETSWASGACAMVRRDLFDRVGGFDADSFHMYCEDVDLSWRIRELGHRVLHQSAAVVFHDKRLTATGTWEPTLTELVHSARSALILEHKWSRLDLVDHQLTDWPRYQLDHLTVAVAEYERRRDEGTLPTPRDPDHLVGRFEDGGYARHRYPLFHLPAAGP